MRVLIACEFSGVVREAFRKAGHDAWSCDLIPSDDGSEFHYQEDALKVMKRYKWDMMIAHPPCTHLAVSGARWFMGKQKEQKAAIRFFMALATSDIPRIAIENPVSIISSYFRKPDQIVQPWQFGHGETKATCLWLKNLPELISTNIVPRREARIHNMPPSKNRGKLRSITYKGIADAMASQWGSLLPIGKGYIEAITEPA